MLRIENYNKIHYLGQRKFRKRRSSLMLEAKNLNKEISIKKIDNETTNIKILNNNILAEISW